MFVIVACYFIEINEFRTATIETAPKFLLKLMKQLLFPNFQFFQITFPFRNLFENWKIFNYNIVTADLSRQYLKNDYW